ncbi:hypothetical protein QEJ31_07895 [Pigmentibacter sp. JX0631]|uniref:hypothetical protein n=1 Tax=Pigmentibacter sp. JX0631 TaxID=2976982 RepID=UPI002469316E|nr:hypothetical protein [Pigmentibacter sp. JX0631]WGL61511.1 hypothetical protein QEJ31_07895 [Pigmentibacter sp. JX0631]
MKLSNKYFCTLLSITLISQSFYSCKNSSNERNKNAVTIQNKKNIDGVEVYKSIVYGHGKVADQIDEIRLNHHINNLNLSDNEKEKIYKQTEKQIEYIKKQDPLFFSKIEDSIKEKNIYSLDDLIYNSKKYIKENEELQENSFSQSSAENCSFAGLVCVAGAAVYVAVVAVHTVGVAHAVARWNWVGYSQDENNNSLRYKKILSDIITTYGN